MSEADERKRLEQFHRSGFDGSRICFEITEIGRLTGKQMIAEWAENAEIIEVLRGLGVD